jgi:hypothetical protein
MVVPDILWLYAIWLLHSWPLSIAGVTQLFMIMIIAKIRTENKIINPTLVEAAQRQPHFH